MFKCFVFSLALLLSSFSSFAGDPIRDFPSVAASSSSSSAFNSILRSSPVIPPDYLVTPSGYYHPTCVHSLDDGQFLDDLNRVRNSSGAVVRKLKPCGYPVYHSDSSLADAADSSAIPPPTVNGWTVASYYVNPSSVLSLSATWSVPPAPTTSNGQIIYLFPGLQPANNAYILQPVLGWYSGTWKIFAAYVWSATGYVYGPMRQVSPNHTLSGTVNSAITRCSSYSVCFSTAINIRDVTSGASSSLSVNVDGRSPLTSAFGAVLESYYVNYCSDFPASGRTLFSDIRFNGALQFYWTSWVGAVSPACGYSWSYPNAGAVRLFY